MVHNNLSDRPENCPPTTMPRAFSKQTPALSVNILACANEKQCEIELNASPTYDAFFSQSSLPFPSSDNLSKASHHLSSPFVLFIQLLCSSLQFHITNFSQVWLIHLLHPWVFFKAAPSKLVLALQSLCSTTLVICRLLSKYTAMKTVEVHQR